jgi:hypothetical protein
VKGSRLPIPRNIERDVLFRNQSICCVCQKAGVQIHHIDGNPSHNRLSNLCVLCLEHHAQASSTSAMVKGLSPSLLRQYKKAWEASVTIKYQIASERRAERPSLTERREIALDIKKALFRLVGEKSAKQVNETIDYLYGWFLLEVGPADILRTLNSIHWLLELRTLGIIVRRLHEFFMGFVGPGFARMSASDERQVIAAIKLLGTISTQAVILEADSSLFIRLGRSFDQFAKIGLDYRRKAVGKAAIREIGEVKAQLKGSIYPTRVKLGVKRLESALGTAKAALSRGQTELVLRLSKKGRDVHVLISSAPVPPLEDLMLPLQHAPEPARGVSPRKSGRWWCRGRAGDRPRR